MKRVLVVAAFLCGPAFGDLVAVNSKGDELRLMHSPCVHAGILGRIKEEYRSRFKKAQAEIGKKMIYACWVDTGDGAYYIVWEDGSSTAYPITGFLDQPGV